MTGYSRKAVVVDLLFHELDVLVQAEHRTQPCRDRVGKIGVNRRSAAVVWGRERGVVAY